MAGLVLSASAGGDANDLNLCLGILLLIRRMNLAAYYQTSKPHAPQQQLRLIARISLVELLPSLDSQLH